MDEQIVADAPVEESTAVYASEGIEPIELGGNSDPIEEKAPEPAPEPVTDPAQLREEIRQQVIQEQQQAEYARQYEQSRQAQAHAYQRAEQEEQELAKRAEDGDLSAQEKLYEKALEQAKARARQKDLDAALEPERANVRNDVRRAMWEEYAKSFGVASDDKELMAIPAAQGMRGINAALMRKTVDKDILEAIKANPAVRRWVEEERKSSGQVASTKAMARALGSGDAPSADGPANAGGRAMSSNELDRALMRDPDNKDLYQAWVARERTAGRHW